MKRWDPDGPPAPVTGVPEGCRAVPLVEVVERAGKKVEVKDRRGRYKTKQVVLVHDPAQPTSPVTESERLFALGTRRRRWPTVVRRYGDDAFGTAVTLVRSRLIHLACEVDSLGRVGTPLWWEPTDEAWKTAQAEHEHAELAKVGEDIARESLAAALQTAYPEMAVALRNATGAVAVNVLSAAGEDLLAGIVHAGPRAFSQTHFGGTKTHDARAVLVAAGVPDSVLQELGLRRGDRIGLGGPFVVTTSHGSVDLAPLVGPLGVRLDQPGLHISTASETVVVVENLQPSEALCMRHRTLPVIYTAGQFGDDSAALIGLLAKSDRRVVAIADADLGGVRIAKRILHTAPNAQVIDVGEWPHPTGQAFAPDSPTLTQLHSLVDDPTVGWFATAVLTRGYPVEQELATLEIVEELVITGS